VKAKEEIVFVDSSILIARTIREPSMRAKIDAWLSSFRRKVSGTIALQEFKRRVLREAAYLLSKIYHTRSYRRTLDFVTNVLPSQQSRKQRICVTLLHQIFMGRSDEELTERARLYLRTLLLIGEKQFRRGLDSILPGVNCYWASVPIREKTPYKRYILGDIKCSKSDGKCEVGDCLGMRRETCERLREFLSTLPPDRLTNELRDSREFLKKIIAGNYYQIQKEEPCLKVGDLLLALESEGTPHFYTMNYRESQAFCDFFQQTLTVRPNNPDNDDRVFDSNSKPWPPIASV